MSQSAAVQPVTITDVMDEALDVSFMEYGKPSMQRSLDRALDSDRPSAIITGRPGAGKTWAARHSTPLVHASTVHKSASADHALNFTR